jgi:hypothetical protein
MLRDHDRDLESPSQPGGDHAVRVHEVGVNEIELTLEVQAIGETTNEGPAQRGLEPMEGDAGG